MNDINTAQQILKVLQLKPVNDSILEGQCHENFHFGLFDESVSPRFLILILLPEKTPESRSTVPV